MLIYFPINPQQCICLTNILCCLSIYSLFILSVSFFFYYLLLFFLVRSSTFMLSKILSLKIYFKYISILHMEQISINYNYTLRDPNGRFSPVLPPNWDHTFDTHTPKSLLYTFYDIAPTQHVINGRSHSLTLFTLSFLVTLSWWSITRTHRVAKSNIWKTRLYFICHCCQIGQFLINSTSSFFI